MTRGNHLYHDSFVWDLSRLQLLELGKGTLFNQSGDSQRDPALIEYILEQGSATFAPQRAIFVLSPGKKARHKNITCAFEIKTSNDLIYFFDQKIIK